MSDKVDAFESIFKRAFKEPFRYAPPAIDRVLLVTDLSRPASETLLQRVQRFLAVLQPEQWGVCCAEDYDRNSVLLEIIAQHGADLIISQRNLKQTDKDTLPSLGVHLDIMTQALPNPVLVLPDQQHHDSNACMQDTCTVMVVTDHILGDDRLVNYGVRLTEPNGDLHLCHIEDDAVFDYYMEAISKIPAIDTEVVREALRGQLLKQPADYVLSCIDVLQAHGLTAKAHAHVLMGHLLADYRRLTEEIQTDLLVLNAKEQDQLAMHGMAYPIAVEFRHLPLLML